ncbi:MAG: lipopolysaccharide transport periplasmic protein LptA [Deltaproteobacteria bacterium]
MRIRPWLAVLPLLAALSGAAAGQERPGVSPADAGSRPIEITADRVSADSVRNSVTFDGNVIAVQGDVTLHANRVHAEYSRGAGAIERIEAEGNVRVVQGGREARSARATFYNLEQRIVLSGGADLRQGENTLRGESLTIYLRENRSVVTGGEGGGRVRAVIHPKGVLEAPAK